MYTYNLNIYQNKFTPVLHAKQGDVGRKFKVIITDGTDGYAIPEGIKFSVWYSGASGEGNYSVIDDRSAFAISGNTVTVELIAQMLNNKGDGKLCLIMTKADGTQIGTWNIPYMVEAVPGLGSKAAEQHLNALADAQKKAEDSASLATQYAEEALIQQENALLFATQAEESAKRAEAIVQNSVLYTEQNPTEEQKAQARENIGADDLAIESTVNGAVITIADSSNRLVQELTLYGRTIQNGTPAIDAPAELINAGNSGSIVVNVCGKNLFDKNKAKFAQVSVTDNVWGFANKGSGVYYIPALPNTTYTYHKTVGEFCRICSCPDIPQNGGAITSKNNDTSASSATITTGVNDRYIAIYPLLGEELASITYDDALQSVQIEIGANATAFEPYVFGGSLAHSTPNGLHGVPVTSGGNYTDSDGQQWACDEIDFARGVYVQRIARCAWTGGGSYDSAHGYVAVPTGHSVIRQGLLCNIATEASGSFKVGSIWKAGDDDPRYIIGITDSDGNAAFESLDDFWTAVGKVEVLAILSAPIETALTAEELAQYATLHTNKPNTTVYNDAGAHMAVSYVADTKTYIDNKFTELAAAIVNS